ncbi:gag-protease polyprotein, partial [Trifolium medium]|nr:gag-protease polyprotein [Trifolium medium]
VDKNMFRLIKQCTVAKDAWEIIKTTHEGYGQCHECEGYGHIRTECATYLKKQKKSLVVSWSDEESEGEVENESAKHITALT